MLVSSMVLSRLLGFGYSLTLGLGLPTLRGKEREAIEEAEGLHLGLLSSKDGMGRGLAKLVGRLVTVKVDKVGLH